MLEIVITDGTELWISTARNHSFKWKNPDFWEVAARKPVCKLYGTGNYRYDEGEVMSDGTNSVCLGIEKIDSNVGY